MKQPKAITNPTSTDRLLSIIAGSPKPRTQYTVARQIVSILSSTCESESEADSVLAKAKTLFTLTLDEKALNAK